MSAVAFPYHTEIGDISEDPRKHHLYVNRENPFIKKSVFTECLAWDFLIHCGISQVIGPASSFVILYLAQFLQGWGPPE